jgi:lipopolysaccharide transport protein LptA
VLLALAYRQRVTVHVAEPPAGSRDTARHVEELVYDEYDGSEQTLNFQAAVAEETEEGDYNLESISRLALYRKERQPLIVTADRGAIEGKAGRRTMQFESGVVITDPEDGLVLTLPVLEVDESAGEARSHGEVRVEGAKLNGRATSLVYGLSGQPTELLEIELQNDEGARLTARKALLHDGLDDVELVEEVQAVRLEQEYFHAGRLRLMRGPDHRLRRAEASSGVDGSVLTETGLPLRVQSEEILVTWDALGHAELLSLSGEAELGHRAESIAAEHIEALRRGGPAADWALRAEGTVYLQGLIEGGAVWLRAQRLEGVLGPDLRLRSATVYDEVRFDGPDIRAEAERATLTADAVGAEVRLFASGRRKARLARGRTRVAAEQIVTDERGERLMAERRVEATLLAAGASEQGASLPGLFDVGDAVHFVSNRLEGRDFSRELTFSGNVRAWQNEQNLSAEQVVLNQEARTLTALGQVGTRIPRAHDGGGSAESDFVQISASRLEYDDGPRRAVFEDQVRVRLAEGWMESERMEVDFIQGGSGIEELRSSGGVRVEFRDPAEEATPQLITGRADRLVYRPEEATIWLYGEESPASVRRIGEGSGTTSGRVLRYQLELGTLEVDSGEQGPARIRTKGD